MHNQVLYAKEKSDSTANIYVIPAKAGKYIASYKAIHFGAMNLIDI
jgi:hypothetical protein